MSIEREGQLPEAPPLKAHTAANRRLNRPDPTDPEAFRGILARLSSRVGLPTPATTAEELLSQLPQLTPEEDALLDLTEEEDELALQGGIRAEREMMREAKDIP